MRRFLIFLLGLFLVPCLLGAQGRGGKHVKLSAEEMANIKYIRQNTAIGIPHELNLADDRQYAYVLDTLRRAGRSAKKSPHLFKLLADAHAQGKPGKPVMAAATGATLQGINYVTEFGAETDGSYYANAFSTYPAGQAPYYTDVVVTLIDMITGTNIGSGSNNLYAETNLQVSASGTPGSSNDDVEVNALFTIIPTQGSQPKIVNVVLPDLELLEVSAPCQLSPNYNPNEGSGPQQCGTSAATTCVNSGVVTDQISVCYGPRINNDCDYGCTGTGNPPNIIFPITGSVNLGAAPVTPLAGSLFIVLTDTAGGGCVLTADTDLSSDITVSNDVASWNLAPASFPNQSCLQSSGMEFDYSFQLYLQTTSGHTGVTFTSDSTQTSLPNTVIVPQMDIVQGCLPEGVKVRMADGSERAVETFQAYGDEKVRSWGKAETRAVTGKTWGEEEKPLVRIRDSRGHTLLLTEAHPVITPRGPVMASQLKKGDAVLTESGEATLVEAGRQSSPRPVPVHNLRVGTEQEAAGGQATFYANGILVGDQLMQRHLMLEAVKPRSLSKEEILRRLPPEWRQDYLNSLADARPQNQPRR